MEVELKKKDRVELSGTFFGPGGFNDPPLRDPAATRGKFLLLCTYSPEVFSSKGEGCISTRTVDPDGRTKALLTLKNYSAFPTLSKDGEQGFYVNASDILPEGTYLAIKNPNLATMTCEDPSEVVLLSAKDVDAIMGKGRDVNRSTCFWQPQWSLPNPFWKRQEGGVKRRQEEEALFFEKLRRLGNKLFLSKCYSDALRFYDLALQYASTEEEKSMTLSNKAAALLRMRCNNSALNIAKMAVELDRTNAKAVYRMGQALIGLGKFKEGANELKSSVLSSMLKVEDSLARLLARAEEFSTRTTTVLTPEEYISLNKYSNGILKNPSSKEARDDTLTQMTDDLAEFVGPVEIKPCENPTMGRGLFATQDISPGEVILVSRAIAATPCKKEDSKASVLDSRSTAALLHQVANQILVDSTVGSFVYQLSAGQDLGFLSADDGDERASIVDMARIKGVLNMNACRPFNHEPTDNGSIGLWFLPSFVNHSCSERNCMFEYYGDILIVKAVEMIPKGAEILRPYVTKHLPYEWKQKYLKAYGFTCTCKLCTFDRTEENSSIALRRRSIGEYLKDIRTCEEPNHLRKYDLVKLGSDLEFFQNLWKNSPLPGLFDNLSLGCIGTYFSCQGFKMDTSFGDDLATKWYEEALEVAQFCLSTSEHGSEKIAAFMHVLACAVHLKRKTLIFEYLNQLKSELVLWYGSIEGIGVYDENFLDTMVQVANNL